MKVICIKECVPVASQVFNQFKIFKGEIIDMDVVEDVFYPGTFYFKHPINEKCYPP